MVGIARREKQELQEKIIKERSNGSHDSDGVNNEDRPTDIKTITSIITATIAM